jgi:hypothetical protein
MLRSTCIYKLCRRGLFVCYYWNVVAAQVDGVYSLPGASGHWRQRGLHSMKCAESFRLWFRYYILWSSCPSYCIYIELYHRFMATVCIFEILMYDSVMRSWSNRSWTSPNKAEWKTGALDVGIEGLICKDLEHGQRAPDKLGFWEVCNILAAER